MKKKILVIAAHPDDEILGCGGTIARLVKEGHEAYTLILGEGITSRDEKRDRHKNKKNINKIKKQAIRANKIIGVKKVFTYDLPDNRFDTLPLLDIVKVIEKVKIKIAPNIILTHYEKDLNIDHRITYQAVLTASRPLLNESTKEIYSFEIPSSTEWSYPLTFSPDVFFNIADTINLKLQAMQEYETELRELPHPRSLDAIKLTAQQWGVKLGLQFVEAFKAIRIIK
jgi:LmbE family N-acetylglucosaminyl deacetylase